MSSSRPAPAPVAILRGHEAAVNSVSFMKTQDNGKLLSGSADGVLKIWDLSVRRAVESINAHTKAGILQVSILGEKLVTQGRDGFIRLWDLNEGSLQCQQKIACGSYTFTKAKTIDSNFIVAPLESAELIGVFDIRTDCIQPMITFDGLKEKTGMCMAIDTISSEMSEADVCIGFESGHLARFERRSNKAISSIAVANAPLTCLASIGKDTLCGTSSYDLHRVQWASMSTSVAYHGKNEGYGSLAVRLDQRIYASGGWDNAIRIFHQRTDQRLATLKYHTESIFSLEFSQDCALLASGSKDKKIALWSIYPPTEKNQSRQRYGHRISLKLASLTSQVDVKLQNFISIQNEMQRQAQQRKPTMRESRHRKLSVPTMNEILRQSDSYHHVSGAPGENISLHLRKNIKKVQNSPSARSKSLKRVQAVRRWWDLHYHLESSAPFRWRWDILMLLLLFYTALFVPYEIAFVTDNSVNALFVMDHMIDVLFCMDMLFNFFTPYVDKETNAVIVDFRLIAKQYVQGWFIIDFVSIFPFDSLSGDNSSDPSTTPQTGPSNRFLILRVLRILRIMKLMRVFRANRIISRWQARLDFPIALSKLITFTFGILVLAHWLGCIWGVVPQFEHYVDGMGNPLDWTVVYNINGTGSTTQYIASLYWAVMTIGTIGYGDVTVVTVAEKIIAILCMVIGCGSYSFIIGSICGLLSGLSEASTEFNQQMDHLNMYMAKEELPQEMKIMFREYFLHMKDQMHHKYFAHALDTLSPGLRGEIEVYTSGEWIHRIPFFVGGPTSQHVRFVTAITQRLVPMLYPPNEVMIHFGDATDVLYIISRGLVARLGRLFGKGHFVGEDFVLSNGIRHYQVRTLTYVDTLALRRDDLNEVLDQGTFPFKKYRIKRSSILLAIARKLEYLLDELKFMRRGPFYCWSKEQECEWFRSQLFHSAASPMQVENRSVVHAVKCANKAIHALQRVSAIDNSVKERDDYYAILMSVNTSIQMLNDSMQTIPQLPS
ncbi:voltage-gated ion channel superfamily [Thraustotheca clavata]|uniref:Voltage-gated ion channel superfamily n=1 Tax=Thraustotheca clavata TaxID=74557 RepID=A0A1W0AAF7_9STRA|nr:voltage-gated ion channel superfamily [Thraustotheca clavata]